MNKINRASSSLGLSFVLAVLFIVFAWFVLHDALSSFDIAVIEKVQGWESPLLTTMMLMFTQMGQGMVLVLITLAMMIILYFVFGHRQELWLVVFVSISSACVNQLLKFIILRPRPTLNRLIEVGGYSFPSGHSMAAFSFYSVVTYLLWRHIHASWGRVVLLIVSGSFILLIGISRIYLGVHYPTDIIGGYLASASWLFFSIWLFERWLNRGGKVHE